jgi:hypothetical protein
MSDTLIFARHTALAVPAHEQPTAPVPSRSFAQALHETAHVEVLEAVRARPPASLLDLINAMLGIESTSREDLLALRAHLRRYSSEVNVLASRLRALARDLELPPPGRQA